MAGETQNYQETRNPTGQTVDYGQMTMSTTSKSLLGVTTELPGSQFFCPAGYWDLGKLWHVRLFGKMTTAATPGSLTIEIRAQTGAVTDAGGTILATSAATPLSINKTNISWWMEFTLEARAAISTTSALFAKGLFMYDGAGALFATAANNPLLIPAATATAVNIDTTLTQTINVQMKRSGSTLELVTCQAYTVSALT
jgi:hypothetical protein